MMQAKADTIESPANLYLTSRPELCHVHEVGLGGRPVPARYLRVTLLHALTLNVDI